MSRRPTTGGWPAAAATCAAAAAIIVVPRVSVVKGPLTSTAVRTDAIGVAAAGAAVAACLCLLVLRRTDLPWHADGATGALVLSSIAGLVVLGWEGAPVALRSAGGLLAPLFVATTLHLVAGRADIGPRWTTWVLVAFAAMSLVVGLARDPFEDPRCTYDCAVRGVAPFASHGAARASSSLLVAMTWGAMLATAALACVVAVAWARRVRSGDRLQAPAATDLGLSVGATIAAGGAPAVQHVVGPDLPHGLVWFVSSGLAIMAASMALQPLHTVRRRHRLRSLAVALGDLPPIGSLEQAIGRAVGDRTVRVAYWLPASELHVDAAGHTVPEAAEWPVSLQRDGEPLAAVWLDRRHLRDLRDLEQLVGSAARLAIDNERWLAERQAQLRELRASRQRIVTTSDETRRTVERSIHDVVQAELIGGLLELARARNVAGRSGDDATAAELDGIANDVRHLVATIRDFSHGVYPAVLDASGLAAAIDALVDDAPMAVTVRARIDRRVPIDLERAAYVFAKDAIDRATGAMTIAITTTASALIVTVDPHPGDPSDRITDRVGAAGGSIEFEGESMSVVLPCA